MKTLAFSTAVVALLSGAAFAQTTTAPSTTPDTAAPAAPMTPDTSAPATPMAPESSNPTTGTGQQQPPMTGNEASPSAPEGLNTGNVGGEPAINSMSDTESEGTTATTMTPPEGFEPVMMEALNADMLMDATIYDVEDSSVGEVSAVMPETGMPETVIVDVGGFLGIGQKPVSLTLSELTFYKETDGEEVRGFTTMTNDQLTDLPEYEG